MARKLEDAENTRHRGSLFIADIRKRKAERKSNWMEEVKCEETNTKREKYEKEE